MHEQGVSEIVFASDNNPHLAIPVFFWGTGTMPNINKITQSYRVSSKVLVNSHDSEWWERVGVEVWLYCETVLQGRSLEV
jgi:hypothetical protein